MSLRLLDSRSLLSSVYPKSSCFLPFPYISAPEGPANLLPDWELKPPSIQINGAHSYEFPDVFVFPSFPYISAPEGPASLLSDGELRPPSSTAFELKAFKTKELAKATSNFKEPDNVLGEGGFGKVYKGVLKDFEGVKDYLIAVKKLNPNSFQGQQEWLVSGRDCGNEACCYVWRVALATCTRMC